MITGKFCRGCLLGTANFPNHQYDPGLGVLLKGGQMILERTAVDRVSTDPDASGYANTQRLKL